MARRTTILLRWLVPGVALLAGGCVPWALGPSRVSTSAGGSVQIADEIVEGAPAVLTRVEADATQLVDDAGSREGDLGVGLVHLDYFGDRRQSESRTGGTISGRWFAHRFAVGEDGVGRLSLGAHADVFWRATGFGGAGGSVAAELEIAGPVGTGDFFDIGSSGDGVGFIGGGYTGEVGFGVRAELGYHVLDDRTHRWTATVGVVLRVPVLGGFVGGIPIPE